MLRNGRCSVNEDRTSTVGGSVGLIDGHVHFWDVARFDYPWLDEHPTLNRAFTPDDVITGRHKVAGFVFIQADCLDTQSLDEVAWINELASKGAPISGIVAHAPLEQGAACGPHLATLASSPRVVGVRRLLQGMPDRFGLQPDFIHAVRLLGELQLVMDLCIKEHQLAEATQLVESCPGTTFVLDHLGKPDIAHGSFEPWAQQLTELAALPNVYLKLSGLATEADEATRGADTLGRYIQHGLAAFGPERSIFGSDWPVSATVISFERWVDTVLGALNQCTETERDQVMGGNAVKVYRLDHDG